MHKDDLILKKFISENINQPVHLIAKKLNKLEVEERSQIIQQIIGRQKIRKKLPLFYHNYNLIIPPSINLEQSSSETTANFKSTLFTGLNIIDITGGLGVDSFAFAQYNKVTHCEINAELAEISKKNAQVLNISNICMKACNGVDFVCHHSTTFDIVYLDPARRNEQNKKLVRFEDCTPNIIDIKERLFEKANQILMKTSPMSDISLGLNQLKNVTKIWIVAVKNEVKEILWLLEKDAQLLPNEVPIQAINIKKNKTEQFEGKLSDEKKAEAIKGTTKSYLYEANASILKAGFFNLVATKFNLEKLSTNSHLYSSEFCLNNFPGRIFEVIDIVPYKTKLLKNRLLKKKINISTRNFPSLVRDLIKKFKIVEGGEDFVFFTQQNENEKIVIFTKKINHEP